MAPSLQLNRLSLLAHCEAPQVSFYPRLDGTGSEVVSLGFSHALIKSHFKSSMESSPVKCV